MESRGPLHLGLNRRIFMRCGHWFQRGCSNGCSTWPRFAQQGGDGFSRSALDGGQDVAIGIEREGDVSVPQSLLHDLRVDALREHETGRRVPQIVEANGR